MVEMANSANSDSGADVSVGVASISGLSDPATHANPYPFYDRLRARGPVFWDENAGQGGGWVVIRHSLVAAALRDARIAAERLDMPTDFSWAPEPFNSAARQVFRAMPHQLLFLDPPDHTRLRGLVNKAFTPRLVEGMRGHIADLTHDLLDDIEEHGEMEVIRDLAYPLPAVVIAELLGVPVADREKFIQWATDFGGFLDSSNLTMEQALQAIQGVADFMDYFREIIARRRVEPQDDLLQALVAAHDRDDRMTEDELLANLVLLLAAGHGTTTHLIGNGLLALLRNPDQYQRLVDNPSLVPGAIAELLRYDAPVQLTGRRAREELALGDVTISAGQHLTILLGAANHDPEQYPNANQLDVGRAENRILSFGQGIHFCLGAPLARLEAEVVFQQVTKRFPHLRLAAPVESLEWQPSIVFRGMVALPVALT
ncbi:MAG TPA: cytochrome P450 [Ktedonobacterales bacterium]|nr:cytochrome P450 [Ktedonobacterales bacterium]